MLAVLGAPGASLALLVGTIIIQKPECMGVSFLTQSNSGSLPLGSCTSPFPLLGNQMLERGKCAQKGVMGEVSFLSVSAQSSSEKRLAGLW